MQEVSSVILHESSSVYDSAAIIPVSLFNNNSICHLLNLLGIYRFSLIWDRG